MESEITAAIIGGFVGLVTVALAALVTLRAKVIDRLIEDRKLWVTAYDSKLLEQRLVEYKKLWKLTEPSSRRHIDDLDSDKASEMAKALTHWYYTDGGMVLSEDTRDAFFLARQSLESSKQHMCSQQWRKEVVKRFSALRSAICEDMNARRGPTLRISTE